MNKIALVKNDSYEYLCKVIANLEKFSGLKVNGLNAGQLCRIEKENPELFAKISEKIREEKWQPAAGFFYEEDGMISDENLRREILYSSCFFKEKFGRIFRTFCGKNICSAEFSQTVYNGRFDCAVLEDEKENFWLDGEDKFRLLVIGDIETADAADIDEKDDAVFETYDEMLHRILSAPMKLKTVKKARENFEISEAEKAVIEAEKASAQAGVNEAEKIRECWFDIFTKNEKEAIKKAAEIRGEKCADNIVKINKSGVDVPVFKFAEDNSGDIVIRLRETAGENKPLFVMCDEVNAGFRCEIEPYETATYRIDGEGFVRETFIFE